MSFRMVYRIREAGIFSGIKEMSNTDVLNSINTLRRKNTGNGKTLDHWMQELGFRKVFRRDQDYPYIKRLWWVRE